MSDWQEEPPPSWRRTVALGVVVVLVTLWGVACAVLEATR